MYLLFASLTKVFFLVVWVLHEAIHSRFIASLQLVYAKEQIQFTVEATVVQAQITV